MDAVKAVGALGVIRRRTTAENTDQGLCEKMDLDSQEEQVRKGGVQLTADGGNAVMVSPPPATQMKAEIIGITTANFAELYSHTVRCAIHQAGSHTRRDDKYVETSGPRRIGRWSAMPLRLRVFSNGRFSTRCGAHRSD
jgi:hypothetical protein